MLSGNALRVEVEKTKTWSAHCPILLLCSHAGRSTEVGPSGSGGRFCSVKKGPGFVCSPKA